MAAMPEGEGIILHTPTEDLLRAINTERPILEMERLIAKYRALAKEQADG